MTPGESLPTPDLGFLTGEVWRTEPGLQPGVRQSRGVRRLTCVSFKETKAKTRRGPV